MSFVGGPAAEIGASPHDDRAPRGEQDVADRDRWGEPKDRDWDSGTIRHSRHPRCHRLRARQGTQDDDRVHFQYITSEVQAPAVAVARIDSTPVKALARAFRWRRMLGSGVVSTVAEIAAREVINKSYVSRIRRLTLLVPAPCRWDQQRDAMPAYRVVMPFTDVVASRHVSGPP